MEKTEKLKLLEVLKKKMNEDASLPLKKGATNLVFGVGSSDTKILFIGEGPGYWEDQKAEPFVGNAGKLLDSLLSSIEMERGSIYITNVVHHRPPENRDPLPEEIAAYGKYLDEIIAIIDPKVIITLGRFSMGKFLPNVKITSVHGKVHLVNWVGKEIAIVPMYHPAAGLRNPEVKLALYEDFKGLKKFLEDLKARQSERKKEATQMELI